MDKRKPTLGGLSGVGKMVNTTDRSEWRSQIVAELLKQSFIYGKKSIDDVLEDAKKIEKFVFDESSIQTKTVNTNALE